MSFQVELLLEHHDMWTESAWASSLVAATKGQHQAIVLRLLAKHSYVDTEGFRTSLSEAAAEGDLETVRALAENVTDDEAKRPKCLAIGVKSACRDGQVRALRSSMQAPL